MIHGFSGKSTMTVTKGDVIRPMLAMVERKALQMALGTINKIPALSSLGRNVADLTTAPLLGRRRCSRRTMLVPRRSHQRTSTIVSALCFFPDERHN